MMDNLIRHLRILWRADSIIADIYLRLLVTRSGLVSFAGLIAVFGLLMLNLAGYLALEQVWGRVWAAVAMGLIDLFISLLLIVIAARTKPGRELDLALEVRSIALRGLENEAAAAQAELVALRDEFRAVKENLTRFVKHPLDTALPALIGPLGGLVLKSIKKQHGSG
jgi:hypothetical protein